MIKRILVTGGDGLLAQAFKEMPPADFKLFFVGRADFDLTRVDSMRRQIAEFWPSVVINTAAYNLVDRCETERDLSWWVNAEGPQKLAELCATSGIRLVHYGTDYVFDGAKRAPYVESDAPNPLNHYAVGKFTGEDAVLKASPLHLVLRTSWIFGSHPTPAKTFVHTVLKAAREKKELKGATDQVSVPTFAPDLAQWTLELIRREAYGLVHAVNDEGVSRFDWTRAILDEAVAAGMLPAAPAVTAVTSAYFNSAIRRPDYSVLSNEKLAGLLGCRPGSWRAGLKKMLAHESRRQ